MPDSYNLDILPLEILLLIFSHCHLYELMRLSYVCKRFYHILSNEIVWTKRCKSQLVTNQLSENFCKRCNPLLSSQLSKWIISYNWKYGNYKKLMLDKWDSRTSLVPLNSCVQMNNSILWWSNNNVLHSFKRTKHNMARYNIVDNSICNRVLSYSKSTSMSDLCKFVLCDDIVISGHSDGTIRIWLNKRYKKKKIHKTYNVHVAKTLLHEYSYAVNAIDATSKFIISGSDNGVIKIHENFVENAISNTLLNSENVRYNKILSLAIDPTEKKCAISLNNHPYFYVFNINMLNENPDSLIFMRINENISNILWEDSNTLLTCSNSMIQEWDVRQNKNVHSWHYKHTRLHCISSDNLYTMMTGTADGKVLLWDKRRNTFIQKYSVDNDTIFSLQFDSSHLYATTHQCLYEYNFAVHSPR